MSAIAEGLVQSPRRGRIHTAGGRFWLAVPLLLLVLVPLLVLALSWADGQPDTWQHLREYLMTRLVLNTLLMTLVVGVGVLVIGVALGWLTACCEFPGRRWMEPLLVLPLAFPTYVLAFVYLGLLDFGGPVQGLLREWFGASPEWVVALREPAGVLWILVLAFYPYVYLLSRASFMSGGLATFEAGRSLGASSLGVFFRVSLPAARPAVVAGLALALMEALADFGAVAIFGFDTFTTAIYRTWFGLFNLAAAAQLASLLMLFMLVLLLAERFSRGRFRPRQDKRFRPHRIRLTGVRAWAATSFQALIVALGVIIPLVQLAVWAWPRLDEGLLAGRYNALVTNTIMLSAMGTALALAAGVVLVIAVSRLRQQGHWLTDLAGLGYAIPGAVLAVAIMLAFTGLDRMAGTALAGSLFALVLAYAIRFLRVAYGPLEAGWSRLRPEYQEAARSLGVSGWQRWLRINLPLLRPGLLTAALLVMVEIAKEMPATLMMRPFGWDTLAVRIFEFTVEGEWERAAVPALLLVLLGAIPVILLIRKAAGPVAVRTRQRAWGNGRVASG